MNAFPNEISAAPVVTASPAVETSRLDFRRNMGQISRHSLTFFAGTLFTMGAGYLVKIYVARVLGAELLGLYALGMTLVSLTQLLGCVGLHSAAARYVAIYNATAKYEALRGFMTRSVAMVVVLNLLFSLAFVVSGGWLVQRVYHAPKLGQYIPLFAVLAFLGALTVFYSQVLAGFKDIAKRTVITNFVGTTVVIAFTVAFLASGFGMRGYLWAQILNSIVVVGCLAAVAWKLTPAVARFRFESLPPMDPEIKAFAAAALGMGALDFLVSQADKILLGFYLNPTMVGIYVVASTLSALIPLILQSVNQIFAPVIADLHAQHRKDVLQKLFQTLTKWVLGLTLPLAFVVIVFALPLMRVFGKGFESGWSVLVIGTVGQVVNCAVGSVGFLLLMSGNQKRLIKVQFTMVAISLATNIALIPLLGIIGAALAAAIINVAGNVWNLLQVRQALGIFPYNRSYFALAIPAMLAAAIVCAIRLWTSSAVNPWLSIFSALVLSYLAFVGASLKFALDSDDRLIVQSVWYQLRTGFGRR
ncbi:MAG TPA: oligosaccharide flippase family protein [Candidatus Sulfotelmatobacter sp.]|nr:oligosaccharide flippase family protein [Candidatus Sulfotelmatobacter sp.]